MASDWLLAEEARSDWLLAEEARSDWPVRRRVLIGCYYDVIAPIRRGAQIFILSFAADEEGRMLRASQSRRPAT